MYSQDPQKRHSGRTTRMLREAIRLAEQRGYVFVICADTNHRAMLREMVREMVKCESAGEHKVYLNGGGQISFEHIMDPLFDPWGMRMRGAHPSCVTLVDHYAIESAYGHLFIEMHRWDR